MKKGYLYYLITGDPLLSNVKELQDTADRLNGAMKAFCDRFGAKGSYGSANGTEALDFDHDKQPEGWVQFRKKGNVYYRPTAKMEGGALLKEMRALCQTNTYTWQKILTGSASPFLYMGQDLCGYGLGLTYIGEDPILLLPVPECGFASKGQYEVPETGVVLLTEADYYQLMADAAKKKAAA